MASCEEVLAGLDRYLDDELDHDAQSEVEAHLADCPECSRLLAERRAAMGLLAEWAVPVAAPSAPAAPAIRGARRTWLRLAAAAAVLAVAGSLAMVEYGPGPAVSRAPTVTSRAAPGKLVMRGMSEGVSIVPGPAGAPDELVVEAFPVALKWRHLSSGVQVISGQAGAPVELVVDPFPEEGN